MSKASNVIRRPSQSPRIDPANLTSVIIFAGRKTIEQADLHNEGLSVYYQMNTKFVKELQRKRVASDFKVIEHPREIHFKDAGDTCERILGTLTGDSRLVEKDASIFFQLGHLFRNAPASDAEKGICIISNVVNDGQSFYMYTESRLNITGWRGWIL